jgi:tryptophan synthase beta chain
MRGTELGEHAARFRGGSPGVLQGTYSYVLQDENGQIALTHSVSAGLDYASIGPEHAALHDSGRAEYVSQDDAAALDAVVQAGADGGDFAGARERARRGRGAAACSHAGRPVTYWW